MTNLQDIELLLFEVFEKENLILATLSSPHKGEIVKINIRPIKVKNEQGYQVTQQIGQKAYHQNLPKEACLNWLKAHLVEFKQSFFYTTLADYHLLIGKKGNCTLLKKEPTKVAQTISHNRQKHYLLEEGKTIPFLVYLGVMNQEGKVYPAKKDKFRQMNRFLEMVEDTLPHLESVDNTLHIIDFGCGKAYLTFALYHFLKTIKNYQVKMVGVDLKADVIQFCQKIAETLGYQQDLQFIQGNIKDFQINERVDMVVSLHACDTATDAALEKAVRWNANVILCVPCCQHELYSQVDQKALFPLLKHGILKERFAALATDAARAQLLETLGYQTQILEFVPIEHTPKNLLIRAIKHRFTEKQKQHALENYLIFKQTLNILPMFERLLRKGRQK